MLTVGVGEDLQPVDEDLGGLAQGLFGGDRAVGHDVDDELVVVGALADAGALDDVGHALDGAEDGVDRHDADDGFGPLVAVGRHVAGAASDGKGHLDRAAARQRGDVMVGVEDLELGRDVDVGRDDLARLVFDQADLDLVGLTVQAADDALEVEDDVGHVLFEARQGGELVRDPFDLDRAHGRPFERRQEDTPQRGAEGVPKAPIERLYLEARAIVRHLLTSDTGHLEGKQLTSCTGSLVGVFEPGELVRLLRVQLDDELLLHRRRDLATLGEPQDLARQVVVIGLQPGRHRRREVGRRPNGLGRLARSLDRDDVVGPHLIRRDVDLLAVHAEVGVADELPRLTARSPETQPVDHVVEPDLEQTQEVLAGDALLTAGHDIVVVELLFEHLVEAPRLLLFAQLQQILGLLDAPAAVLARRVRPTLDRAFVGEAALALEKELHAFAPALLALG